MQNLTPTGQNIVNDLSARYNLSHDAVMHMLIAVNNGAGTMAQFNCPELGGGGQWMAGGMTMVGDMFNHGLKNTVNNLCAELANALANNTVFEPIQNSNGQLNWWPNELGQPFSSGGQNNSRYAVFPNRLAVEVNGVLTVYDTLDHNIGGVSQQQGSNDSLVFNSQYGSLSVASLPQVTGNGAGNNNSYNSANTPNQNFMQQEPSPVEPLPVKPQQQPEPYAQQSPAPKVTQVAQGESDVFALIEKLANLRTVGAITEDEYHAKKNELLNRI